MRSFGIAAHRTLRQTEDGGLTHWLRSCAPSIRALGLRMCAVGASWDAIEQMQLLAGYEGLQRLPYGREGGVMRLASRIAGGLDAADSLDGIFYLLDPLDPSSLYPEALALKRQCVIHAKPFVATVAGAIEWVAVEAVLAGAPRFGSHLPAGVLAPEQQTIALVAHDALKSTMVDFASRHFELLSRASRRVGTGTTSGRLNEMAWARGWPRSSLWVEPFRSGPLGGDAQIAELVLDRRCQKVIFFEDVHVARQHEADIQLLERAVCTATRDATCFNTPMMAQAWAQAWSPA